MKISRIVIKNYRNFKFLDVEVGENAVLLGENGVGKTNFLEALRLILDPSKERQLSKDDFHYPGKAFNGTVIRVDIFFRDIENDKKLLYVFRDCFVQEKPELLAQVTYIYRPKETVDGTVPPGREGYLWRIFGRDDEANDVSSNIRKHLRLRLIPALRDIDRDISIWRSSPLRRLVELMNLSDDPEFIKLANDISKSTDNLQKIDPIFKLKQNINTRLTEMIEGLYSFDPQIGMLPSSPDQLQRTLKLFVENNLGLDRSSLGLANVLYLTLLMLEIEQQEQKQTTDVNDEYIFNILAVEEPESHLHPHLQRLVFGDFLKRRPPVLLSTHSPQIVSIAQADSLILLKDEGEDSGTIATSTAGLSKLPNWEPDWDAAKRDIERFLDATRGEVVFSKGVILVEGEAESFLIPEFARKLKLSGINKYSLDGCGVSVCSVAGTDFVPYVRFLGPSGLDLPLAIITDGDKYVGLYRMIEKVKSDLKVKKEVTENLEKLKTKSKLNDLRIELDTLGYGIYEGLNRGTRIANILALGKYGSDKQFFSLDEQKNGINASTPFIPANYLYEQQEWDQLRNSLAMIGVFVNDWTLEIELLNAGYQDEFIDVYRELGASVTQQQNMREQISTGSISELTKFMTRIEETGKGKGRFAQRLSDRLDVTKIPPYIQEAITHIINRIVDLRTPNNVLEQISEQ